MKRQFKILSFVLVLVTVLSVGIFAVGCGECEHSGGTATCENKAVCEKCGEEYGELAAHKLTKTDKVNPTCDTAGTEAYWTCGVCDKMFSDAEGKNEIDAPVSIAATGHEWGEWTVVTEPTCETAGQEKRVCENDSAHVETKNVPAKGHTLTKTERVEPTCDTSGTEAYWTCSVCDKMFSDAEGKNEIDALVSIPATGHVYSDEWHSDEENHWKECECGEKTEIAAHANALTVSGGKREYIIGEALDVSGMTVSVVCSVCDYESERDVPVTADMVSGFDSETAGEKQISIEYDSMTVNVSIEVKEMTRYTLTIADGTDVSFADGAMTAQLVENAALPEITNITGKTIAGWYNVANKAQYYEADTFTMPAENITIAPYFNVEDGYTKVDAHVNPNYIGETPYQETDAIVEGGSEGATVTGQASDVTVNTNGYAKLGKNLSFTGSIAASKKFRLDNPYKITRGQSYDFVYNFQNNGDKEISLKIWWVYTQITTTADKSKAFGTITLAPGASIQVKFSATEPLTDETKPTNNNTMVVIQPAKDVTDMQLGVAISVKPTE